MSFIPSLPDYFFPKALAITVSIFIMMTMVLNLVAILSPQGRAALTAANRAAKMATAMADNQLNSLQQQREISDANYQAYAQQAAAYSQPDAYAQQGAY